MSPVTSSSKSAEMSRVRTRDTAPELAVRAVLHHAGFRFRLHVRDLPGTPDILLPRHRLVIFVHGCFWHGHKDCTRARLPSTRLGFWQAKIARNVERDGKVEHAVQALGWRTLSLWSCEIRTSREVAARLAESLDMDGRPIREITFARLKQTGHAARGGRQSSRQRLG